MKVKCNCGKIAVWVYMPGKGIWACCDDCVPRGCSCNSIIIKPDNELTGTIEFSDEQERDNKGRLLPCCEWIYDKDGFDE